MATCLQQPMTKAYGRGGPKRGAPRILYLREKSTHEKTSLAKAECCVRSPTRTLHRVKWPLARTKEDAEKEKLPWCPGFS